MATIEERKKEKRERIQLKSMGSSGEPITTELNYKIELPTALNYYSMHYDNKQKYTWIKEYLISTDRRSLIEEYDKASDYHFLQIASLVRLKNRSQYLAIEHQNLIESKLLDILKLVKDKDLVEANKPTDKIAPVIDVNKSTTLILCHKLDEEIDQYITNKKTVFSVKTFLATNSVKPAIAKCIAEQYKSLKLELEEAISGSCEQLNEGYSYFTSSQLKSFYAFVCDIINTCLQQNTIDKAPRKVRVQKEKPAYIIVKNVKYKVEDTELNIKSVNPTTIVGASELLVYNTKYKTISVYHAIAGHKLSVKGSTILNYDITKSLTKKLRKPNEFILNTQGYSTKKNLESLLALIKTNTTQPNGRINLDTILIKVY